MKPGAPLPWKQWPGADHPNAPILIGQPGQHVCAISGAARAQPGAEQNAAYIVHAANLYPELVEALEAVMTASDDDLDYHGSVNERIRTVLAKCGEE